MGLNFRLPRIRLTPGLLRLAYRLIDVEASGETAKCTSRVVEYSFVVSRLACKPPGRVLDVGCASSVNMIPLTLARLGWEVHGIDLREWDLRFSKFRFSRMDVRKMEYPDCHFDCAYDVSTMEHVGVSGRYRIIQDDPDADLKECEEVYRVLRAGGTFYVSIPYGPRYKVIRPMGRVYDQDAARRLFSRWEVSHREVWAQDQTRGWTPIDHTAVNEEQEAVLLLELVKA